MKLGKATWMDVFSMGGRPIKAKTDPDPAGHTAHLAWLGLLERLGWGWLLPKSTSFLSEYFAWNFLICFRICVYSNRLKNRYLSITCLTTRSSSNSSVICSYIFCYLDVIGSSFSCSLPVKGSAHLYLVHFWFSTPLAFGSCFLFYL